MENRSVASPQTTARTLPDKARRMQAGRIILTGVLALCGLLAFSQDGWWPFRGRGVSHVVLFIVFSLVYSLAARFLLPHLVKRLRHQLRLEIVLDVAFVTWLVWLTGDAYSPFAALYTVIIAVTVVVQAGSRATLLAAIVCAALYTALTLAVGFNFLAPSPAVINTRIEGAELIEFIGKNAAGILIVGLLAAKLAKRHDRSDEHLKAARHALANLRSLHERIIESLRSGLLTADLEGRIFTFNKAAEEITGFREAEARGRNVAELFGPIKEHLRASLRAAERGQSSPRYQAAYVTNEGLLLQLGFSIVPLYADDRRVTGVVILFQDLTETHALEELARRQDRLAAVGRVAAGVAHEIRNPLAAMTGSIQVLRSELGDNQQADALMEIVLRESSRLNRIITDFLTYARPRRGEHGLLDLCEVIRETSILLRHSNDLGEDHEVEVKLPEAAVMVRADAEQLRQVFWNLARNALQAMPEGGALRIVVERAERAGGDDGSGAVDKVERDDKDEGQTEGEVARGFARLIFTDTGDGMTPAQVERLFEPFASTKSGGTGLGLPIVYQIIRDHNGSVRVSSREGEGTSVVIELPSYDGEFDGIARTIGDASSRSRKAVA